MQIYVISSLRILLSVTILSNAGAFLVPLRSITKQSRLPMVGGRGWDNSDYLSGLGGDEEEREKVQKDYEDFSERRSAFEDRQRELMKNPQAQAFFRQQQQQLQQQESMEDNFNEDSLDEADFSFDSGGGSRMAQMMARAKRMGQPKPQQFDFQQKFAPLDDIDEDSDD